MHTHVPLRSILLATNLSDIEWLFPFTCSLAEESGAHITVLHVITALNGFNLDLAGVAYYHPNEAIAAATAQLEAFCCNTCTANHNSEVVAVDGTPADRILAMAAQSNADLLVMGTEGHRGVDKWLHGSVAERVLRTSPIPVVTVGPNARRTAALGRPTKSILFATSLKAHATDAVNMDLMLRWTERLHGHLTLLHVMAQGHKNDSGQERRLRSLEDELSALMPDAQFREGLVDSQVRTGQAAREILAAGAHSDLIALGALRSPLLGRLAPEGTLYQVLAEAHCPVATLHSEHAKVRAM